MRALSFFSTVATALFVLHGDSLSNPIAETERIAAINAQSQAMYKHLTLSLEFQRGGVTSTSPDDIIRKCDPLSIARQKVKSDCDTSALSALSLGK